MDHNSNQPSASGLTKSQKRNRRKWEKRKELKERVQTDNERLAYFSREAVKASDKIIKINKQIKNIKTYLDNETHTIEEKARAQLKLDKLFIKNSFNKKNYNKNMNNCTEIRKNKKENK